MKFRHTVALIAGLLVALLGGPALAQVLPTGTPTSFPIKGVPVTTKGIVVNQAWIERGVTSGTNVDCTLYVVFANVNSTSKYVTIFFDGVGPDYIVKSQYSVSLSLQRPNTWAKRSEYVGSGTMTVPPSACNSNIIDWLSGEVINFIEFNGVRACDDAYSC
jgi:peptidoglycan hydrolase-like protein with peptidoglycan-binding domain